MLNRYFINTVAAIIITGQILPNKVYSIEAMATDKVTLKEAIQTALKNNPRQKANQLRLDAAQDQVTASKQAAYLPNASLNYSQNLSDPSSKKNGSFSINMNIFNGFADYYRIKAQQCRYEELQANYNSTTTLLQNTNGHIVGQAVNAYVGLISSYENFQFYSELLGKYQAILPYAKSQKQKTSIASTINSLLVSVGNLKSGIEISEIDYKTSIYSDLPTNFESILEISNNIDIPLNADEAYQISLEKSPEILGAKLALQCQGLSHTANKRAQNSTRIDLSASRSTNFDGQNTNNHSVSLNITVPINIANHTRLNSESKNLKAAELDLEDTQVQIKNNLLQSYIVLKKFEISTQSYKIILADLLLKSDQMLNRLNTLNEDEIDELSMLLSSISGAQMNISSYAQQIIDLKIKTQKNIGTLFELTR